MRILRGVALTLCALLLWATLVPGSKGSTWNKKTVVTFGEDVEIPGKVLPAGTYVFKLAGFHTDRHIVQIWNADENQLLATVVADPAMRLEPANDSVFEFEERPSNSPMVLKYWFYPGDTIGQEFSYSHTYGQ